MDEGKDGATLSANEYMEEGSGGRGSSGDGVSLESESVFAEDMRGGSDTEGEGRSKRHGKGISNVPKLEVLWRYFEEASLMDSSGSDFEVEVDAGADDSPNVSLVSERELENVYDVEADEGSRRNKVVLGQQRTGRRKAACNGAVLGEHPLKGDSVEVQLLEGGAP